MISGIIYRATSPSNKKYYGYTSVGLNARKDGHLRRVNKGITTKFASAIRKYGIDNLQWDIIETHFAESKQKLKIILAKRETYWIDKDDTFNNGYNMTLGGDGRLGSIMSIKTKENLVKKLTGRITNRKGKTLEQEKIEIYGEEEGKKQYDEWINKFRLAKLNKPQSLEQRNNISKSNMGKKKSLDEIHRRNKTRTINESLSGPRIIRPVICTNIVSGDVFDFDNYTQAALFLNISRFTVKSKLLKNITYNNYKIEHK